MRVGVLEFLVDAPSKTPVDFAFRAAFKKQYASIMPQAVSVWCQQLGHTVYYATYYGQRDPRRLIPEDLDVLFVSTYTQSSAVAYAIAKLFRAGKTLTVIGGPHAKSFPADCLRFFDWVVLDCDKALLGDLLGGGYDRNSIITSGRPLRELPSLEERMPFVIASTFANGRPAWLSIASLLSSVGCPYSCDFCVDWKNPYVLLPLEQLEADLRFLSARWPNVMIAFHDPNFGVKFDQVLTVLERIPPGARNPYIMESSLSILKGTRLQRLKDTHCVYVAPGVESWADYSNKAGVGRTTGRDKLEQVVSHFEKLSDYVIGLQANFIFGTDVDRGSEPVELTKEFIRRLPFVWPTVNIPTPFGDTPLYDKYMAERRVLRQMPFSLYYTPYLVTIPANYHPVEYYEKLHDIFLLKTSARMLGRRLLARGNNAALRGLHALRTVALRQQLKAFRQLLRMLRGDSQFLAFHEGRSSTLPEFYDRVCKNKLGPYASLLSKAEREPELDGTATAPAYAVQQGGYESGMSPLPEPVLRSAK